LLDLCTPELRISFWGERVCIAHPLNGSDITF